MISIGLFTALILWNFYLALIYDSILYVSFLVLEIFFLISGIIQTLLLRKGLSAVIQGIPAADAGKSVSCGLVVANHSRIPLLGAVVRIEYVNIYTGQRIKLKKRFSVGGHSETVIDFKVASQRCGIVRIRIKKLTVPDCAGFIRIHWKYRQQSEIIFIPELTDMAMEIDAGLCQRTGEGEEFDSVHPGDDPSEVFQIREYMSGDRLQSVHWKASAKNGRLMVKDYAMPVSCTLLIVADMKIRGTAQWKNADDFMKLLLSYSLTLIEAGCHHCIAWYDQGSETVRHQKIHVAEDVYMLMDFILRSVPYTGNVDVEAWYKNEFPYDTVLKTYVFSMDLFMREGGVALWDGKAFLKDL